MHSHVNEIPDFNKPQRQATIGIVVEILYTVQKTVKTLWPLFLIFALRIKEINPVYTGLIIGIIILAVVVIGYLNYRNFLFHIDDEKEEFILARGVFNKKRVVLQLSKIQQVNINQSFVQKLVNVYAVELETAGSAKSEAKINAVSKAIAIQLRTRLSEDARTLSGDNAEQPLSQNREEGISPTIPFIKISFLSLIKIAITSNYLKSLGLLIAFVATVYSNAKDIWFKDEARETEFINYVDSLDLSQSLLTFFGSILFIVFLINLVRMVVLYFNFKISRHGESLLLSYGLLNTKNTIIRPLKVQVVSLVTNFFQRKMNLQKLFVRQASSDITHDKKATLQIPGCNTSESEAILKLIFGTLPQKGNMLKPNIRKVFASVVQLILIPVLIYFTISIGYPNLYDFLYIIPVYLLLAVVIIYFNFLNDRLFINEHFITKQSGVWDIETKYLQPFKIQAISTRQNWWHVKANIGHVILHTAGGDLAFKFANFSTIQLYVNLWLYQVETFKEEWM